MHTYSSYKFCLSLLTLFCFQAFSFATLAKNKILSIELSSGEEITSTVYGHNDNNRILWISSSFGFHERHHKVATAMANSGLEAWQVNLAESLFLPNGAETMRNISPDVVADLIETLSEQGKYHVLVISTGYGSIPALRGVHAWQSRKEKQAMLDGVILFTPYFYTSVPALGMAPALIPELVVTNIPVYILQAEKNGNRWHLPDMLNALQQNAPVYTEILKGVISLFHEDDTTPEALEILERIVLTIQLATKRLKKHPVPLTALPLTMPEPVYKNSGLNTGLTLYKGKVKPSPINLNDVYDRNITIDNYKGKVTLINFWATWCPPCVEEIPSLNRLKEKMKGKPFQLISVNYAESADRVQEFMKKVSVDFPVLIDPQGQLAGQWKVVAFPSTFVIGPDGNIQYGVNAAIHWDTDQIISQLNKLIEQ